MIENYKDFDIKPDGTPNADDDRIAAEMMSKVRKLICDKGRLYF